MIYLPKISIITPSYNQGHYLEETICSIISQNYLNYELIIIDGASKDNTVEVIKKYEEYITYWVSEPDRGQSHAIQKGLTHATGDIINWINSDDLVAPGAFHALAKEFDLDRYDVLCGTCDYFVDELAHLDKRNERMGVFATVGDTLLACHINQPSTFFKASVFKQLGIDEQFHYTMDVDLWYRYLLTAGHSRIHLSDKLLTYFRLHGTSKTVVDHLKFEGDRNKVYYNVMLSLNQPPALLGFMSFAISDFELFKPTRYPVGILVAEAKTFIRTYAWLAVQYYNGKHDYPAARVCLQVARRYGQPLTLTVLRQLIKHYLIPTALLRSQ
ncbi:glycosyltransferase family 2 protein [Hymenobacter coccineus]|uniref:Glycosyltransferase 2-like domain-containing protein n=1 Tax=Hymenobacter coccineus TaxID=1908235 RepID=A0A1G1TJP0_9BACT|nr:glycosyltransferase family 2 protein [Hymenobacter coccineus]OGX91078.1 hypothetical protein BEN49_05400 [Hymenobacter coccineus]